jgi:hypothetical protein
MLAADNNYGHKGISKDPKLLQGRDKFETIRWYPIIIFKLRTAQQIFTSERVAPPMMKTKIRCPIFLNSLAALFKTESLQKAREECWEKFKHNGAWT